MKRLTPFAPLFLFIAVLVTGLAACDSGEQNFGITPGDSLTGLTGPSSVTVPSADVTYRISPFTIDKDYAWTVVGPDGNDVDFSRRRSGEFIDFSIDEPGTYTVNVDDGEYVGETTFEASFTDVVSQAGRLGFGSFADVIDLAGLTDTLGTRGPFTTLAPSDEALAAAFDTTDDGMLNVPASAVLNDILQYNVIADSIRTGDISDGQTVETLGGGEVTFHVAADGTVTVEDGTASTEDATISDTDLPSSNGLLQGIDRLLLPPFASVAFNDQTTAGDTVNVRSVYVPRDGYVAIHDSTLLGDDGEAFTDDDQPLGSVVGVSEYLEAGLYNNVKVALFEVPGKDFDEDMVLDGDQTLIAMPHEETNGNMEYNFITSGGSEDVPYFQTDANEKAVISPGAVTVSEEQ